MGVSCWVERSCHVAGLSPGPFHRAQPVPIRGGVHVVQGAQKGNPPAGEVGQRVGQRELSGPTHRGERSRGAARRHCDQPIAAVRRRAECGLSFAERAEGVSASSGSASGMSQPMMATRPWRNRRKARCMRTPRSPPPWASLATRAGRRNRAWSGVTASTVRKCLSAASARTSRVIVATWNRKAARSPMSRASRRLTAPRRGARANTTTVSFIGRAARSAAAAHRRNRASGRRDCAANGDTSPGAATSRRR